MAMVRTSMPDHGGIPLYGCHTGLVRTILNCNGQLISGVEGNTYTYTFICFRTLPLDKNHYTHTRLLLLGTLMASTLHIHIWSYTTFQLRLRDFLCNACVSLVSA